tara:strand:+ start:244 stop:363 length:120 start_codon:yes stop_codon:yes gene_type:complete
MKYKIFLSNEKFIFQLANNKYWETTQLNYLKYLIKELNK